MIALEIWSIKVKLPKNRDNNGTLTLYQAYEDNDIARWISKHSCACKGKGIKDTGSPDSWKKIGGNTPTGIWEGAVIRPGDDAEIYGPNKRIELTAISGNALIAVQDYGRRDFQIHGGRSQTTLWNTEGCIRVFDKDIKKITEIIENLCGGGTGTVDVIEI